MNKLKINLIKILPYIVEGVITLTKKKKTSQSIVQQINDLVYNEKDYDKKLEILTSLKEYIDHYHKLIKDTNERFELLSTKKD